MQDHPENSDLSDREISVIDSEVEKQGKVSELAEALEMADHLESTGGNATVLLRRSRKEMALTRKNILFHLKNIGGLQHLADRLVF